MPMSAPAPLDRSGLDVATQPGAVRAHKRPLPVQVRFATEAGKLQTLEGPVRYRPGDALLTGAAGERWPVTRARFDRSYRPEPPTQAGQAGRYVKQPVTVWALRMDTPFSVRVGHARDPIVGGPGDWLVQYGADDYGVISATIFEQTYERLDDG